MNDFKESKLEEKRRLFDWFAELNSNRKRVRYVVKKHTEWVDRTLFELISLIGLDSKGLAFVGVGGYGRKQLNPHSDIDILVLKTKENNGLDSVVRDILDFFYFVGYECSVSVRSIDECVEYAKKDSTIKASLLDSRFLLGDRGVWERYSSVLKDVIVPDNRELFIEQVIAYMRARYEKFGGTVFVLEPNVKEGVGSLRDYHSLLWIAKVLYGAKSVLNLKRMGLIEDYDYRKLMNGVYFLWQLRNALHLKLNKKNDVLFLDLRDEIAESLKYKESKRFTKSERLMRRYYYEARGIKNVVNSYINIFLNRDGGAKSIFLDDKMAINDAVKSEGELNVYELFQLFYYSAEYSKPVDSKESSKIRGLLFDVARARRDKQCSFIFRQMLSLNKPLFKTISSMHELGVLDRYIPEFGNVCCLTKDGLYHKYTVDEHSIQAVKALDELYNYEIPKTFLMRLKYIWVNLSPHDRYVLRLACLFHDIGKIEKESHEVVGAELSRAIAKRLFLGRDLTEKLIFLVRHHLLMSSIISTRDVDDPKTLEDFLKVVDSKEKLILLSLLTYADMKSVNDNVWSSWKEDLMEALYLKATFYFENKDYDEYLRLHAADSKRKVKAILGKDYHELVDKLPDNIFNDIRFDVMAEYIRNIKDTGRNAFVYREGGSDTAKVVVYYNNEFGFFNKISGILACLDASIITAKSYDLLDGKIVDVFTVKLDKDSELDDFKVEDLIYRVKSGDFDLDGCMEAKRRRFLNRLEKTKLEMSLENVDVVVDNSLSELYTVIRVYAPDRIGLVYYITKVLLEFQLQVGMFILDTKGSVAVDTFYVVDKSFRKIYSEKLLELIKSRLYEVLV